MSQKGRLGTCANPSSFGFSCFKGGALPYPPPNRKCARGYCGPWYYISACDEVTDIGTIEDVRFSTPLEACQKKGSSSIPSSHRCSVLPHSDGKGFSIRCRKSQ